MKTTIHTFDNIKAIKPRELALPSVMTITQWLFDQIKNNESGIINLDTERIYQNHWIYQIFCIPDFAIVEGCKHGYYLEQTPEMINARDNTYQCGICNEQFPFNPYFCPYCINNPDIDQETIYKAFCRPVSTLDIEITHKSIRVPEWVRDAHTRMPELTSKGVIINV